MTAVAGSKSRTRAVRREPCRRKLERDAVGVGVSAADLAASPTIFDDDVLDCVPPHIVVAAKVCPRAE
jgi:hypothetical protein